ncbi:hypothetical protein BKA70DRAFT_1253724 [Coprinopsis sp. MPI-PUGE-AT-0042]|nr:hypothetical protein BKA70DRAFT_1253724 [Coprinopsis sp. MPI-PUGE-AT-0042]
MPVTFKVADHPANPAEQSNLLPKNPKELLVWTRGRKESEAPVKELLQSSFSNGDHDFSKIVPHKSGFIDTVIEAYNQHHHLILRPDDVWMAILGQLNFYVNAHSEDLRSLFVAHEGVRELELEAFGTRYTVDFGDLAKQMTGLLDANVVDKELKDWILPDFSTTTENDTVISAVFMMATLKSYFHYTIRLRCGLPSVTLKGERSDWVKLYNRLEKLESFGDEPKAWVALLRPILSRFVSSFDGEPDLDFWSKICHYQSSSGGCYICGWITAFAIWSYEGKWQGPSLQGGGNELPVRRGNLYRLRLDDAEYGVLNTNKIPSGICEVDVHLDDNGEHFDCMMIAGHLAHLKGGENDDSASPLPGWFMFIK